MQTFRAVSAVQPDQLPSLQRPHFRLYHLRPPHLGRDLLRPVQPGLLSCAWQPTPQLYRLSCRLHRLFFGYCMHGLLGYFGDDWWGLHLRPHPKFILLFGDVRDLLVGHNKLCYLFGDWSADYLHRVHLRFLPEFYHLRPLQHLLPDLHLNSLHAVFLQHFHRLGAVLCLQQHGADVLRQHDLDLSDLFGVYCGLSDLR